MINHKVYDRKEYKGYFSLLPVVEEDILNWEILMDCYDVIFTRKCIAFREKDEEE